MSKLTAAYIAGFIDGEGYFGILKNRCRTGGRREDYYTAVLKIGNTDKDIIYWLKNSFGGTIWIRDADDTHKTVYQWTLETKKLVPFIDKIYPYLKIKKKQAELLRELRKTININSYHFPTREAKNGGKFVSKTLNVDIVKKREELYEEIRKLNKRGNSLHAERLNKETSERMM